MKISGPDWLVWRFVTGQPLDGHYRTDARFWHRGATLIGRVPVRRWSYLPGYQRAVVRLTGATGVPVTVWQYRTHPDRTILAAAGIVALAVLWAGWRGFQRFRARRVYRTYVKPLHAVLGPLLGLPADIRPADYITVPPSFRTREETPVRIALPKRFAPTKGSREQLSAAVLPKLGWNSDNADAIFHFVGNPVMEIKIAPQPPDRVLWADHLDILESLKPGEIFVGLGARDKPYIRNFNSGELVHGGFSVQTGFGKSATAMSWLAQGLHNDRKATATYIDPKHSQLPMCLLGVPGYTLLNDLDRVDDMWTGVERFEEEMDRRIKVRDADPTKEFPLMFLVLDELSEFADMTKQYWDEIREKGSKGTAPIWRSISRIVRMGREFGCRVIVFTQRLDNKSAGGFGIRDLFGWRGLAGFRPNQWMMLIGTRPIPKSVNRVGRWIYDDGAKTVWVQNVYATPTELRDWAMSGRRAVDTQGGHMPGRTLSPGETSPSVQWDIIGLQAAADYLDIPVGTFRKRRQRHPIENEGIVGRSPAWKKTDLDQFAGKVTTQ